MTPPRVDARPNPQRLGDDLIYFADHVWHAMNWNQYAPLGWVEYDIYDWVQNGPSKQGVLAPRAHGKTHLITIMLPCWDWYKDANAKCLLVSKSKGHAKKSLSLIRDMLEKIEFLRHLSPGATELDQALMFDVRGAEPSRTPSLEAAGVESQLPGNRSGRILADDMETPENTRTSDSRDFLKAKFDELINIATYGDERINIVGTFHHADSAYKRLKAEGMAFRTWPICYPKADEMVMAMAPLLRQKLDDGEASPGDIVDPDRYDTDYIAERKAKGLTYWANNYMLLENLGDRDQYRLRLSDLIVHPCDRDVAPTKIIWGTNNGQGQPTSLDNIRADGFPGDRFYAPVMFSNDDWAPYSVTRMWVDPAGKGLDRTGIAIVGGCMAHLYVKYLAGLEGGSGYAVLSHIALTARRHGATEIHVEDFAQQMTTAQLLEPVVRKYFVEAGQTDSDGILHPKGWRCSVELTRPAGGFQQKEQRMLSALEPVTHNHRLVVDPKVAANERFQYQLTRLTGQRNCLGHEDELEALANCVALFVDDLRHDPEQMAKSHKDRQMDKELEEHYKLLGLRTKEHRMFTPLRA